MCLRLNAAGIAVPTGDRPDSLAFSDARLGEGQCQSAQTTVPVTQVASTTRPKAMRYQAKATKVWLDT